MATQLNYNRVEREKIDNRLNRFNTDRSSRKKFSTIYNELSNKHKNIGDEDIRVFMSRIKGILNEHHEKRPIPEIPFMIIYLALIKDLLDFAELTGFAIIITIPISLLSSGILIYWSWNKTSFRAWREKLLRWLIVSILIELIPGLNFIPATLILVMIIHYNETQVVRLINTTIDFLDEKGVFDE